MPQFYAHSLADANGTPLPPAQWEPLADHLHAVAHRAAAFAAKFNASSWGRLMGLWHDVGKYRPEFQAYLFKENGFEGHLEQYKGRVDHSTAGAQHAIRELTQLGQPDAGRILAYCIAGHHAGLADADTPPGKGARGLNQRLDDCKYDSSAAPDAILRASQLTPPTLALSHGHRHRAAFQVSLFCRMLFSCLVDADYLATETFMSPDRACQRPQPPPSMGDLEQSLNSRLDEIRSNAKQNSVFDCRQEILAACRHAGIGARLRLFHRAIYYDLGKYSQGLPKWRLN